MKVIAYHKWSCVGTLYAIRESQDGPLYWEHIGLIDTSEIIDTLGVIKAGVSPYVIVCEYRLDYSYVTITQAEALTGMYYPAAMDRLRELVQDNA